METDLLVNLSILAMCLIMFLSSCLMVRLYSDYAKVKGLMDVPNARSAHHTITPRGAGIVFISIWLILVLFSFQIHLMSSEFFWICFPPTLMMMLLGFWEDTKSLSPRRRLFLQGIAALFVLLFFGTEMNGFHLLGVQQFFTLGTPLASFLAVLWLMWSTNLFNFMDGLDGLAAIEALFVLGLTGFLYLLHGDPSLAYLPWCLCCGVLGFLMWNWPKAKVFMGDVGSYCLGFLIGIFALIGDIKFGIPFLIWVIAYGVFWFDATLTLFRRLLMGKNIALAHRDHAYQRLYQSGFSHQQILCWVIAMNCLLGGMAFWVSFHHEYLLHMFGVTVLILSICYYQAERLIPLEKKYV